VLLVQCGELEIFSTVFCDIGKVFVGEFGIVDSDRGMTSVYYEGLGMLTDSHGEVLLGIPYADCYRILRSRFDQAFQRRFDLHNPRRFHRLVPYWPD
jgi:hypothetical protein